jgi:hypothetical protein
MSNATEPKPIIKATDMEQEEIDYVMVALMQGLHESIK